MGTLYVSDLDGTLLRSTEITSDYTNSTINRLAEKGMLFSYATARSWITAKKATRGIHARIPLIVYNGVFVIDNVTEEILITNYLDDSVHTVIDDLLDHEVYPIVYAYIDGKEKFSYVPGLCTQGMRQFLGSRKGDIRENPVTSLSSLKDGNIFYITCIDEPEKLEPLYHKYRDAYHVLYQKDIYTGEQWLEIMPPEASKSHAARQLQEMLGCDKLIVFGDGQNDVDLFQLADACYAVANAHEELKKYATAIIGSNDEDGVAKWLEENVHIPG